MISQKLYHGAASDLGVTTYALHSTGVNSGELYVGNSLQDGDYIIVTFIGRPDGDGSASPITLPTGFDLIAESRLELGTNDLYVGAWGKFYTDEVDTIAFSVGTEFEDNAWAAHINVYAGVDPDTPIDFTPLEVTDAASDLIEFSDVTLSTSGVALIRSVAVDNGAPYFDSGPLYFDSMSGIVAVYSPDVVRVSTQDNLNNYPSGTYSPPDVVDAGANGANYSSIFYGLRPKSFSPAPAFQDNWLNTKDLAEWQLIDSAVWTADSNRETEEEPLDWWIYAWPNQGLDFYSNDDDLLLVTRLKTVDSFARYVEIRGYFNFLWNDTPTTDGIFAINFGNGTWRGYGDTYPHFMTSCYAIEVDIANDTLNLVKFTGGTRTVLDTSAITFTGINNNGCFIYYSFQTTLTGVDAYVWINSETEPVTPTLSSNDTSIEGSVLGYGFSSTDGYNEFLLKSVHIFESEAPPAVLSSVPAYIVGEYTSISDSTGLFIDGIFVISDSQSAFVNGREQLQPILYGSESNITLGPDLSFAISVKDNLSYWGGQTNVTFPHWLQSTSPSDFWGSTILELGTYPDSGYQTDRVFLRGIGTVVEGDSGSVVVSAPSASENGDTLYLILVSKAVGSISGAREDYFIISGWTHLDSYVTAANGGTSTSVGIDIYTKIDNGVDATIESGWFGSSLQFGAVILSFYSQSGADVVDVDGVAPLATESAQGEYENYEDGSYLLNTNALAVLEIVATNDDNTPVELVSLTISTDCYVVAIPVEQVVDSTFAYISGLGQITSSKSAYVQNVSTPIADSNNAYIYGLGSGIIRKLCYISGTFPVVDDGVLDGGGIGPENPGGGDPEDPHTEMLPEQYGTVQLSHRVIATLGDNRFNDDQVITASSTKSSNFGVNRYVSARDIGSPDTEYYYYYNPIEGIPDNWLTSYVPPAGWYRYAGGGVLAAVEKYIPWPDLPPNDIYDFSSSPYPNDYWGGLGMWAMYNSSMGYILAFRTSVGHGESSFTRGDGYGIMTLNSTADTVKKIYAHAQNFLLRTDTFADDFEVDRLARSFVFRGSFTIPSSDNTATVSFRCGEPALYTLVADEAVSSGGYTLHIRGDGYIKISDNPYDTYEEPDTDIPVPITEIAPTVLEAFLPTSIAGDRASFHIECDGFAVRIRVWRDIDGEPTGWNFQFSDLKWDNARTRHLIPDELNPPLFLDVDYNCGIGYYGPTPNSLTVWPMSVYNYDRYYSSPGTYLPEAPWINYSNAVINNIGGYCRLSASVGSPAYLQRTHPPKCSLVLNISGRFNDVSQPLYISLLGDPVHRTDNPAVLENSLAIEVRSDGVTFYDAKTSDVPMVEYVSREYYEVWGIEAGDYFNIFLQIDSFGYIDFRVRAGGVGRDFTNVGVYGDGFRINLPAINSIGETHYTVGGVPLPENDPSTFPYPPGTYHSGNHMSIGLSGTANGSVDMYDITLRAHPQSATIGGGSAEPWLWTTHVSNGAMIYAPASGDGLYINVLATSEFTGYAPLLDQKAMAFWNQLLSPSFDIFFRDVHLYMSTHETLANAFSRISILSSESFDVDSPTLFTNSYTFEFGGSSTPHELRLYKNNTVVATYDFSADLDFYGMQYILLSDIRVNKQLDTVRIKIIFDVNNEPEEWTIEYVDPSYTESSTGKWRLLLHEEVDA